MKYDLDFFSTSSIHSFVEHIAMQTPDAIAVVGDEEHLTYGELNKQANYLANLLTKMGVSREIPVAISMERSPLLIIGLLAILKAGGVYVPMDSSQPIERLQFILNDTEAPVLLTEKILLNKFSFFKKSILLVDTCDCRFEIPSQPIRSLSSNLAYIIYTSGSTGKPKGVCIEHVSVLRLFLKTNDWFQFSPKDTFLLFHSYAFDFSVWEIWGALIYGARLVIASQHVTKNAELTYDLLQKQAITIFNQTPSAFGQLIAYESCLAIRPSLNLRFIIFGGEAPKLLPLKQWFELHSSDLTRLINMYGITEITVHATFKEIKICDIQKNCVTDIGIPIPDSQVYLLSDALSHSKNNEEGEIYVGGKGLARCYLHRPDLTAERFVADLFSFSGERLYRSGDHGVFLSNGTINYRGRKDKQVKIRGHRIELSEIEIVLTEHRRLKQIVLNIWEDPFNNIHLIAYLIPFEKSLDSSTKEKWIQDLHEHASKILPDYMRPSAYVFLHQLPLNSSGKIDYKALPTENFLQRTTKEEYYPAQSKLQQDLVSIWSELLLVKKIGIRDNFFALGGHSLLVMQVISKILARIGLQLPFRTLFLHPTIEKLSEQIHTFKVRPSERFIESLPIQSKIGKFPLSVQQRGFWFFDQLVSHIGLYNIPIVYELHGPLCIEKLQRAFDRLFERHNLLKTRLQYMDEEIFQLIDINHSPFVQTHDFSNFFGKNQDEKVSGFLVTEAYRPFELVNGDLTQICLLKLGENQHLLMIVFHHIIVDGWSLDILWKDLSAFYSDVNVSLPDIPIHYFDFVMWQRKMLQENAFHSQLEYWQNQLKEIPDILQLPYDHPRPSLLTYKGSVFESFLSIHEYEQLKKIGESCGATLYMVLLSVFQILLYKYSGQKNIVVGAPLANRADPSIENTVGFFVNSVPLASYLDDKLSFFALLKKNRDLVLDAQENQDLPFEILVDKLGIKHDLSRHPIFQVMFILESHKICSLQLQDIKVKRNSINTPFSRFDLTVWVEERIEGLDLRFEYATDLFEQDTIRQMSQYFTHLITQIATKPLSPLRELSLLSKAEIDFLYQQSQGEQIKDFPDTCIHRIFEEQVRLSPDKIAFVHEGEHLTFQELNKRANQLAKTLTILGLGIEKPTAVFLERSPEMFIVIMSLLKVGSPYIILDLQQPKNRLFYFIEDSQASYILTQSSLKNKLEEHSKLAICIDAEWDRMSQLIDENSNILQNPNILAYVIYTSGSTGLPKGVSVTHRNLIQYLHWFKEYNNFTNSDRFDCSSPLSFDLSVTSFLAPFIFGATVCLCTDNQKRDPFLYLAHIKKSKVSFLKCTPGYFAQLKQFIKIKDNLTDLRTIILGGETLHVKDVIDWLTIFPHHRIINEYGPTEATVGVCADEATMKESADLFLSMPIGKPAVNSNLWVLDSQLHLVPTKVRGELFIGGDFLARGYLRRPDLTAEKFIAHPFLDQGQRLYKTGDFAYHLPSGKLDYIGRIDNQVKIRGYRIELNEIEYALKNDKNVKDALVSLYQLEDGQKKIVAYIIPSEEHTRDILNVLLRESMQKKLPEYMIPNAFMFLEEFPLANSEKIDYKALPIPNFHERQFGCQYIAPRTEMEKILQEIWSDVLGIKEISVQDNFFEIGGDSIISIQLVSKARRKQIYFEITQVFQSPTIEKLALVTEKRQKQESREASFSSIKQWVVPSDLLQKKYDLEDIYPLSPIQEGLLFSFLYHQTSDIYFTQRAFEIEGPLDLSRFELAWHHIINLFPILRSVFQWEGLEKPLQIVLKSFSLPIERLDWCGLNPKQIEIKLEQFLQTDRHCSFDLSESIPMRFHLIKTKDQRFFFIWSFHHLILDGWSVNLILRYLMSFYFTGTLDVPSAKYRYFIDWLANQDENQAKQFWINYLHSYHSPLTFSSLWDKPVRQNGSYQVIETTLSISETTRLKNFAKRHGITLNTLLQGVWGLLLGIYAQRRDIVFGVTVSGRSIPLEKIEEMIGICINTIPFRIRFSWEEKTISLLLRLQEEMAELHKHAHISLAKIQTWLAGNEKRTLFDTLFVCENFPKEEATHEQQELKLRSLRDAERTEYPLMMSMIVSDLLTFQLSYEDTHFTSDALNALLKHLQFLIDQIVVNPSVQIGNLISLTPNEQTLLFNDWNKTRLDFSNKECFYSLFEKRVLEAPDRIAVIYDNEQITYKELEQRALKFARLLQEIGVNFEKKVVVSMHPSLNLIIVIIGILKAGAVYVPLDPEYPQERLNYILADTQAHVAIIDKKILPKFETFKEKILFPEDLENESFLAEHTVTPSIHPNHAAYIIYTSGSTGYPKGIVVEHASLCNCLNWLQEQYSLNEFDAILNQTSISFDVSIEELLWPICSGARLVLMPSTQRKDLSDLISVITRNKVSVIEFVPSLLKAFLEEEDVYSCESLKKVFVGGEALTSNLADLFFKKLKAELYNIYGPTETTIDASVYKMNRSLTVQRVSIGRPIANLGMYILNSQFQLLPFGIKGELYISGKGLARGYLDRPSLTAEKFIPNPYASHERLYQTGDNVRYFSNGNLEYCGRIDNQIKLRGYRIEIGEIEEVLLKHEHVAQSVVKVVKSGSELNELVAFVTKRNPLNGIDTEKIKEEIKSHLSIHLPDYMIPSLFIFLDKMPLTSTGKIDRQALSLPDFQERRLGKPQVLPQNELQKILHEIWLSLLGIKEISIHDNFFELGGDSIISIQLVSKARQKGIYFEVKHVFQSPTIARLALLAEWKNMPISPRVEESLLGKIPLTPIQHWFFEQKLSNYHHYNQSILLELRKRVDFEKMNIAFDKVIHHHDVFQLRYTNVNGIWQQFYSSTKLENILEYSDLPTHIDQKMKELESSLNIEKGPMIRALLLDENEGSQKLFIVIHHLIVDGVSWRILLEDLENIYEQVEKGKIASLPVKTHSYAQWSSFLQTYAKSKEIEMEIPYWEKQE